MTLASSNSATVQTGEARLRGHAQPGTPGCPLISVVIVVLDGAATLERALQSVFAQTYVPLEIIIRDGGSTDGTLDILRRHDDRLGFWSSAPDSGLYDAMNQAVAEARGDWLLFLGADDVLLPSFSAAAAQCRDPNTIYYGDVVMLAQNRRYDGPFTATKLAHHNICQQAIFYPRAVFEQYSFDTRYQILADWVMNMCLLHDSRFRFQYVPEVIAKFDDRNGISSRRDDDEFLHDYLALVRANFPAPIFWWRWAVRMAAWPLRAVGLTR